MVQQLDLPFFMHCADVWSLQVLSSGRLPAMLINNILDNELQQVHNLFSYP